MTQPLSLKEQIRYLEQLQELDLKIDRLNKDGDLLPATLRLLDESVNGLKSSMNERQSALAELEKIQRQTRAALDLNKERLARSTGRLEAVQNSQEFQAVTKEIEQLKKLHASLQEQDKKSTQDVEILRQEMVKLTTELEQRQGEREVQFAQISTQREQLTREIAELNAERSQYLSGIEGRILSRYNRVRVARGGLGFVPAIGGRCKGCNMVVPPQLYNEVQKGLTMQACPSCHRILFVPVERS